MVQAVLTGRSSGLLFDLACFSSLSSERLCVFGLYVAIYINFFLVSFLLSFSEASMVGLALDLVD